MSSAYGWVIIKDNLSSAGERSYVGVCGPRDCPLSAEELTKHPDRKKFRMKDDDGEVHYYGYWVAIDPAVDGTEHMFGPLDDFGMPNAGCAGIDYFEDGLYKPL